MNSHRRIASVGRISSRSEFRITIQSTEKTYIPMQSNIHPDYAKAGGMGVESPVKPCYCPEISPETAAKGLGSKFPYSGGAMATHKPSAMAQGTHSYSNGMEHAHVIHDPRLV